MMIEQTAAEKETPKGFFARLFAKKDKKIRLRIRDIVELL